MAVYRFEDIAINSTEKKKPVEEDKYTYLGLEHLDPDSIYVTRFGADIAPKGEKLLMKKGDVLFGKRRAYQKKVAIAPFDGIFSAHGMVLRPNEKVIDKDFFPLFIKSDYFLDEAIKISVGSLSPTINWRDLKELRFSLPSLEEQKKLAQVLWSIYETKEEYKKLIKATDDLVKSQFIEMFGDTEKYHKKQIADVAEVIAGGDKPKDISEVMTDEYCYPVYANGIEKEGLQCYSKEFRVDKAAVTISARGTIGATFIRSPFFTPVVRLIAVIPKTELNPVFLKYAIDYAEIISNGSSQQQLTIPNVKKIKVVVPPVSEQNIYADLVVQSDKSKFELQDAIDNLDALSKKIIAENLIAAGKE